MKDKNKEPKQKKQKKSVSQKITGINTTSSISYGDADLNPKDKKVKWIFVASIISLLVIGIGVPVGLTGAQYISQKAYDKNTTVLDGLTVGDLTTSLDKNNPKISKDQEKIENIIVEILYKEERNAFLKFEAFVNATKYKGTDDKVGPTSFGFDVSKSYSDIKKDQQKKLDNARKAMQESNPTGWKTAWNNELKTNEIYGSANNDGEAVDFMTKKIAKEAALARFNTASINTDKWTEADLTLQAQQDIKYKDDSGKENTISVGTKLFSDKPSINSEAFLSSSGENIALPTNRNSLTPAKEVKLSVYETKSYVLTERNPLNRISSLYDDYFKSANISSISISITKNLETSEFPWTITRDLLFNLLKIVRIPGGKKIISIDKISNFKGANTSSVMNESPAQMNTDKTIINTLGESSEESTKEASTTGSQLGSSKVTSLATLIKEEENTSRAFNVAAISSSLTPTQEDGIFKIKQLDPIKKFLKAILEYPINTLPGASLNYVDKLIVHLKSVISIDASNNIVLKEEVELSKFNKELDKLIKNISDSDFNSLFSGLLSLSFVDNDAYGKGLTNPNATSWSVYELSKDTNLYVDETGLKIYNIQNVDAETSKSMLKSDIQNTIDVLDNPDKVVLYDIAAQYNKIANDNIINKILIEEMKPRIIEILVDPTILNPNSKDEGITKPEAEMVLQKVYINIIGNINNIINPETKSAMSKIPEFVDTLIKPNNSYDFFVKSNSVGMNETTLMNGFDYSAPSLFGKRKIYTQFWNKLEKIISVKVKEVVK